MNDDDYDDTDDDFLDDDESGEGYACPECGGWVYEDATQCGRCGYYYVDHQPWYYAPGGAISRAGSKPIVIAVVIMLICIWVLSMR